MQIINFLILNICYIALSWMPCCSGQDNSTDNDVQTCTTPQQPNNGQWILFNSKKPDQDVTQVEINRIIKFTCNNGYKLSNTNDNQTFIACLGPNQWSSNIPQCNKICPPLKSKSKVLTLKCVNRKTELVVDCSEATDGVKLTYQCDTYYKPEYHNTLNCINGEWDNPLPSCIPVCGESIVSATPLILDGSPVQRGHYPWTAAIYSNRTSTKFENICGASLLKPNIVITAAHCVTDPQIGKVHDAKYFRVGVGKYYNAYNDERDRDTAQYAEVDTIVINSYYRGQVLNFRSDIALIRLKSHFILSRLVQPVCYNKLNDYELIPNTLGVVTGWGYTKSSSTPSDILKELVLPYKDQETCSSHLDSDFALRYFLHDKICAGYFNNGTGLCRGDSGGGLAFKHGDRYFIHGVTSVIPTFAQNENHCDFQKNVLFTNVTFYSDWLNYNIAILEKKN